MPSSRLRRELQRRIPALQVIVSVAPTVALDADRCPFRLVHSASLSVLRAADAGAVQERHDDARGGGRGLSAGRRLSHGAHLVRAGQAARERCRTSDSSTSWPAARSRRNSFRMTSFRGEWRMRSPSSSRKRVRCDSEMLNGLAEVRAKLGSPGAADRVARIASDLVGPRG